MFLPQVDTQFRIVHFFKFKCKPNLGPLCPEVAGCSKDQQPKVLLSTKWHFKQTKLLHVITNFVCV